MPDADALREWLERLEKLRCLRAANPHDHGIVPCTGFGKVCRNCRSRLKAFGPLLVIAQDSRIWIYEHFGSKSLNDFDEELIAHIPKETRP